jgi:DNA polymerase-4
LTNLFGKSGVYYYNVVRGIHNGEVKANRIQKSVAVERTFSEDLNDDQQIRERLEALSLELEERLSKRLILGKSLTLKIKYKDFSQYTRSKTQENFYNSSKEFYKTALQLWNARPYNKAIRLLGLSLSNLNTEEKKQVSVQLKIPFEEY